MLIGDNDCVRCKGVCGGGVDGIDSGEIGDVGNEGVVVMVAD